MQDEEMAGSGPPGLMEYMVHLGKYVKAPLQFVDVTSDPKTYILADVDIESNTINFIATGLKSRVRIVRTSSDNSCAYWCSNVGAT